MLPNKHWPLGLLLTTYFCGGGVVSSTPTDEIKQPHDSPATNTPVSQNTPKLGLGNNDTGSPASRMGVVPHWIEKRTRATKVLEKPLDSQLEFHEGLSGSGLIVKTDEEGTDAENGRLRNRVLPFPPALLLSTLDASTGNVKHSGFGTNVQIPVVRYVGVQKQNVKGSSPSLDKDSEQKIGLKRKEPVKRQGIELVAQEPLQFSQVVSPLEASLGGFSGLQGLPPLSFVQFTKLLVALTPFILPMIFIPLLIFTVGILMLPVTRSNVFVDVGDLRGGSASPRQSFPSTSTILSNYLISPVKKFTGNVVMPRAYGVANDFLEHEECVERISCEISARYLHYNRWDGTWRSIANRSWISRIMSYLWGNAPTVGRIAKSLDMEQMTNARYSTSGEVGKRGNATASEENVKVVDPGFGRRDTGNGPVPCKRYTCHPKRFLQKMFPLQ